MAGAGELLTSSLPWQFSRVNDRSFKSFDYREQIVEEGSSATRGRKDDEDEVCTEVWNRIVPNQKALAVNNVAETHVNK
jgi:hypothetical protein